ncbi:hypothetical protein G6F68_016432 [Rhizopus microsporus]|nr:hypothetical protein G6F68_016432 [Rhizopus microsporus]
MTQRACAASRRRSTAASPSAPSGAARRGVGSTSAGHRAGRRFRSRLTTAPALRARSMPAKVASAMAGSVRLLEQTWKHCALSRHSAWKSLSRNSRSAAGGR